MQLSLATKLAVINSFADYPVTFIQQAGVSQTFVAPTAANAADASTIGLRIQGFGDFYFNELRYARAIRPVNGTKHKISVDSAQAAQITVAAGLAAGQSITARLRIGTDDSRGEFASEDTRDNRYFPLASYITVGNDTAAQVLAGLTKSLTNMRDLFPEADGAGEPFKAVFDGAVLTIEAADDHLTLELTREDIFLDNNALLPVLAPVTVTPQFAGRGTYEILHNVVLETEGSNEQWSHSKRSNLPVRNTLYTQFAFGIGHDRPELSGNGAAGSSTFQKANFLLYVAQTSDMDPVNDAIATFFNRTPAPGQVEFVLGNVAGTTDTLANWIAAPTIAPDATVTDSANN